MFRHKPTHLSQQFLAVGIAVYALTTWAAAQGTQAVSAGTWSIVPQTEGDLGLKFSLGWSLGTHEGQASRVTGSMQAQTEPLAIARGEFRVPIASMSTGSPTRDCHMREALGINYQGSRFPSDHVCVSDQVPASGPDSVVFPEIVIGIREVRPVAQGSPVRLTGTQPVTVQVPLSMSVHGVTREVALNMRDRGEVVD